MSWSSTYSHAIVIALDMLGSVLLWTNRGADVTVSSMCGLELRKTHTDAPYSKRLVWLGRLLNWSEPGHCEAAIRSDLARLEVARALLTSIPPVQIGSVP